MLRKESAKEGKFLTGDLTGHKIWGPFSFFKARLVGVRNTRAPFFSIVFSVENSRRTGINDIGVPLIDRMWQVIILKHLATCSIEFSLGPHGRNSLAS
jgi:hypothetical protein